MRNAESSECGVLGNPKSDSRNPNLAKPEPKGKQSLQVRKAVDTNFTNGHKFFQPQMDTDERRFGRGKKRKRKSGAVKFQRAEGDALTAK
jgi:hypothetical protein